MTSDRETSLFEFATSNRPPTDEEEQIVTDIHAALGMRNTPIRLMRPPVFTPATNWNRHLFAMAAVLVTLALATASFITLQPKSGAPPTEVPPAVLGLASQGSATPEARTCDLTGDVPFIAGMNDSPLDVPTVLHTMDKLLVLECNGEQETLLQDVMIASPTRTPHVVHAITMDGDYFINIVTSEQLFIPAKTNTSTSEIHIQPWGPWLVMRSTTDETAASVYNLETMTETPIITHARVHLSIEEATDSPMHSDDNRFVIAYPMESEADTRYLHGFFILEADGSSKVVAVGQEAFPRELAVSPDGQLMAIASFHGTRGEGTTTVTLIRPEDDAIVEQYELQTLDQPVELAWQHDGSGLLLHDIFNLYRIDSAHPGDGLEILAEGQNLQGMVLTPDNDVVAIGHSVHSQSNAESKTLIVHIPTREVIEVEGHDLWANPYLTATRATLVLEGALTGIGEPRGPLTVVDAVTGETLGTIQYEPLTESGFQQSSYGTGKGDITVVAFRPDSIWRLVDTDGNATLEQIEAPPLNEESKVEAITIVTSREGYLSLRIHDDQMQSTAWILTPDSTEWIQLDLPSLEESQGMLPMADFVAGED